MHFKLPLALSIAAFAFAAAVVPSASAAPTLYYNFEALTSTGSGTVVDNLVGTDGTLQDPGSSITLIQNVTITTPLGGNNLFLGKVLQFSPVPTNLEGFAAPRIETENNVAFWGITGTTDYTAMVWMNLADQSGDNMVFGQGGTGEVLHLGARDLGYHDGHWGDDLKSDDAAQGGLGVTNQPGAWHHVAFTNVGQTQTIYVDGMVAATGASAGAGGFNNNLGEELLIASSRNGGAYNGQIDEVRVFNNALSQAEIQQFASAPEPTSIALLASGVGMAVLLRRRRARP